MAGLGAGSSPAKGGQQQQQGQSLLGNMQSYNPQVAAWVNQSRQLPSRTTTPIAASLGVDPSAEGQLQKIVEYQRGRDLGGSPNSLLAATYKTIADKRAGAGMTNPGALPDPQGVLGGQMEYFNSGNPSGGLLRMTPMGMANQQANLNNLLRGNYDQVYSGLYGTLNPNTQMAGQQEYQWNLPNAQPGQWGTSYSQLSPQGYALNHYLKTNNRFGPFRPGG